MKLENTQVQMRKGILEFCILEIIARGEAYASDMLEELTSARMIVVEGTLYPLLTRLKNAALLDYVWKESTSGHPANTTPSPPKAASSWRSCATLGRKWSPQSASSVTAGRPATTANPTSFLLHSPASNRPVRPSFT